MSSLLLLSDMDLSALLVSRVCHDVISPVGAIANGLEVLEDEDDEEMKKVAMDLVRRSAKQASAKLQFCAHQARHRDCPVCRHNRGRRLLRNAPAPRHRNRRAPQARPGRMWT